MKISIAVDKPPVPIEYEEVDAMWIANHYVMYLHCLFFNRISFTKWYPIVILCLFCLFLLHRMVFGSSRPCDVPLHQPGMFNRWQYGWPWRNASCRCMYTNPPNSNMGWPMNSNIHDSYCRDTWGYPCWTICMIYSIHWYTIPHLYQLQMLSLSTVFKLSLIYVFVLGYNFFFLFIENIPFPHISTSGLWFSC